jgi:phytol kinase
MFGLMVCAIYLSLVLTGAEWLRRRQGYSNEFTRKAIHISTGMMIWLVPFLFETPWLFVGACIVFVFFMFFEWYFGLLPALASKDRRNLGTVYFPIAVIASTLVFWRQPALMVAALMPLTWGDGLAPIVGRAYGRHHYQVLGHNRTWQGSGAFFVAALLFTWLPLWLLAGPTQGAAVAALLPALGISLVTSIVEGVTIWGLDNLTVTGIAILLLYLWPF